MINLPKPSPLRLSGSPFEQINYLANYLKTLVTAIEQALGSIRTTSNENVKSPVVNIAYSPNGLTVVKEDGTEQIIAQSKILWSGAHHMNQDQTAILSSKISEQPNGIVLVFSAYVNGKAQDNDFREFFIPKETVKYAPGKGHDFLFSTGQFGTVGCKYLYISNDKITGYKSNNVKGTSSGISYENNHWVMRYVIGV